MPASSSNDDPKAKAKAKAKAEPAAKAKANAEPTKGKLTLPKGEQLKEESSSDPDIEQKQQAPLLSPKRTRGNITV